MNKKISTLQISICILLSVLIIAVVADIIVVKNKGDKNSADVMVSEEVRENTEEVKEQEVKAEGETKKESEIVQAQDKNTEKEDEYFYADVYNYLTVRSEPNTNGGVLYEVPGYTRLLLLSEKDYPMVYVKVIGGSFDGVTGYVNKEYITREGEKSKKVDAFDQCFVVSGVQEYLPLRSNCFYDDKYEIGRLYNGDKVLLEENLGGDFWLVKDVNTGNVGYVTHKYLRKY